MNVQEYEVVNVLADEGYKNQRELAERTGYSLGKVNSALKTLGIFGYVNEKMELTTKAKEEIERKKPRNAVILAAGFGMRMVPINVEVPKGILEVHGEPLIERLIRQLLEVGVREIDIVVGFMKEQYEYLIDKYGVNLVFNKDYAVKNNLYSLRQVLHKIGNTYIIPCDVWCRENPFSEREWYSWYMVGEEKCEESIFRVNRKKELVLTKGEESGNCMIGIAYILEEDAASLREQAEKLFGKREYWQSFWEDALVWDGKMHIRPREVQGSLVCEINTLEELRELDHHSSQLNSDILALIENVLNCKAEEIVEIRALKKGMTNRSFQFSCRGKRYIARIPGEGTGKMINREQEYDVYQALKGKEIADPVCYISPENGYKITEFVDARTCDPDSDEDVARAMKYLRAFHECRLEVKHSFDLYGQMEYYESLWNGEKSVFKDYPKVKEQIYELKTYIEQQPKEIALTHIDANHDNFLFTEEKTYLIDWEYAGMQDIHVDIAMFAIYAMYDRERIDWLIDLYFEGNCTDAVRTKIYCYIAVCGLLWSNWCEYKRMMGVEFGEYSLKQYRYAKEFYRLAKERMEDAE